MILLLDHEDSFVHTLARYVAELGCEPVVRPAGALTASAIGLMNPKRIILSPGPRTPGDRPVTVDVIRTLGPTTPILGVCLGHQCIASAYGAEVGTTANLRHGRASSITHDGLGVFAGVPSPFLGARYHSLAVTASSLPEELTVSAVADDGEVMGIRHRLHPVEGVQFHPESVLTEWGYVMLANFLGRSPLSFSASADSR